MVGVSLNQKTPQDRLALPQSSPEKIQGQCSSCGLQWKAAHEDEVCPIWELEAVFLSADWFMISGD